MTGLAMPPPDNVLLRAVAQRTLLEQANGVLMWRLRLGPEDAAAVLRRWADGAGVDLLTVCDSVVNVLSVPDHPRARELELLRRLRGNLRRYDNES